MNMHECMHTNHWLSRVACVQAAVLSTVVAYLYYIVVGIISWLVVRLL